MGAALERHAMCESALKEPLLSYAYLSAYEIYIAVCHRQVNPDFICVCPNTSRDLKIIRHTPQQPLSPNLREP